MKFAIPNRQFLIVTYLLFLSASAWANPFLSPQKEKQPEPVRPPSFAAPSGLIDAQFRFRETIADVFSDWSEEKRPGAVLTLAAAAFLYGILHALGPGHRKMVIFSLFIARKAKAYEPLLAGFLSSALHGMSAAAIMIFFRSLSNRLLMDKVNLTTIYLEGFTYLLLALLALILLIVEIGSHIKNNQPGVNNRGLYGTIALTSAFPCPAAVMILIFSLTLDLFSMGILAVAALSLGMGVTISFIGFLAWGGRETLLQRFKGREDILYRISHILEGAGYAFLILFSLWMALPFIASLPGLI